MIDKDDLNIEITVEDTSTPETVAQQQIEKNLTIFDKCWIGVPIFRDGKKIGEETREIGACSGQDMLNWATVLYNPISSLGYEAKNFETRKKKEELFYYIIGALKTRGIVTR